MRAFSGFRTAKLLMGTAALALLTACGGGGGGGGGNTPPPTGSTPTPSPTPTPTPTPSGDGVFQDQVSTGRFISRATFGPTPGQIERLVDQSASDWLQAELVKPATTKLAAVRSFIATPEGQNDDGNVSYKGAHFPRMMFWNDAISADDQLRQRMAYALSQIFVVSNLSNDTLYSTPQTLAAFQDILARNAFGNYRDLLEDVTYSVAMGHYLTYLQNQKGNPSTGRMPDENYAREILQLFTIGLVYLNMDGSVQTDSNGDPRETYTNDDITGLAKVFTGLSLDAPSFWFDYDNLNAGALYSPMIAFPEFHSDLEKSFLGTTISAGTGPAESIDLALDAIFAHPNLAPFIGRQLIQRFTASNPSPAYIQRVASAFETGSYVLPDGDTVGEGRRGDLAATIAAVLMDDEVLNSGTLASNDSGKIREPAIRFVQWARAFDASPARAQDSYPLWVPSAPSALSQAPYGSASVFNFYRPGYIAPGTLTGEAGMTVPELQLMNAGSVPGFANFMMYYIFNYGRYDTENPASFVPDYTDELALADDPAALIDHLDALLTYGQLSDETKNEIVELVSILPLENGETDPEETGPMRRVKMAILAVMTSPDYLVQK